MYCIAARWTTLEGEEDRVAALAASMLEPSRAEAGCHQYDLHRDPDDPRVLFLYEQYDDEAAFDAHCASAHFRSIVEAQIFPLLGDRRLERYRLDA